MNDGRTPLHSAAEEGHFEIVKYMADQLKDKNPSDQNGNTSLSLAIANGHHQIVSYLHSAIQKQHSTRDRPSKKRNVE